MRAFLLLALSFLPLAACTTTNHWPDTARMDDGSARRYEVHGEGEPTIVFIHGWACHRLYWNEQLERFQRVRHVVAIDLAGHGESEAGHSDFSIQSFGDDVVRVCDQQKLQHVVLVGHSMGGLVALDAAKKLGSRVVAVVAVETLHDVSRPVPPDQAKAYVDLLRADFPKTVDEWVRKNYFPAGTDPELVDLVAKSMSGRPPEVEIPAMESMFAYDAGAALAAIDVPVHCINTDRPTNVAAGQARNPRFTAVAMPGVGHFPMLEQPEAFARLLADFVRPLGEVAAGS